MGDFGLQAPLTGVAIQITQEEETEDAGDEEEGNRNDHVILSRRGQSVHFAVFTGALRRRRLL